ncbi:MAG: enoyl-CoA hydratase/isomerase family protein [Candidatus Binataceae bacterium]|nr:enoyl-CoA hydratase/isomerase family protein [Candidatus Binataceae bacterium]
MSDSESNTPLLIQNDAPLGWLIFNRPQVRNALNLETWRLLASGINQLEQDPAVRVIILRGSTPKAFISGADISEFPNQRADAKQAGAYRAQVENTLATMIDCGKPVLAMISGLCIGGGIQVALACDIRFAAKGTRFGVPAGRLGLAYPIDGVMALTHVVGPANARDILFSARLFEAEEAYHMGLVSRLVEPDALDGAVREYALKIADNAPLTVSAAKIAIREALKDSDDRDLHKVRATVEQCYDSEDYREGVRAFLERRPPKFNGR